MNKSFSFSKEESKEITPAFGIDLGTTNSAISVVNGDNSPVIIKLDNGKSTMPSCVSWIGGDDFIVGDESYAQRWKPNTIYSVKRLMGSGKTIELKYKGETKIMTPPEVSAKILMALCDNVKSQYPNIKDVVITVPAKFNNKELEDTKKAGELAGLNILNIFREPTSASLCYNIEEKSAVNKKSTILVYDLGGGTFDVSLVEITKNKPIPSLDELYGFNSTKASTVSKVIKNDGSVSLGGDNIDKLTFDLLSKDYPILLTDKISKDDKEKLILTIERLKKTDSRMIKTSIESTDGRVSINIGSSYLDKAVDEVYATTKKYIDNTLSNDEKNSLSSIVLVGGSTKSARIKSNLRRDFPNIVINDMLNPDESVALGAAIQANNLKFKDTDIQLFDILPLALGIETEDYIERIIPRNSQVPCSKTKKFVLKDLARDSMIAHVYQGNSSLKEECLYLGSLNIDNIDVSKQINNEIPIYVTLKVDFNGILSVRVEVNGKDEELRLVNIFTSENTSEDNFELDDRSMKKLRRWNRLVNKIPNQDTKLEFEDLLDLFGKGKVEEDKIISFIEKEIDL